jgi:HEAT repeat protein
VAVSNEQFQRIEQLRLAGDAAGLLSLLRTEIDVADFKIVERGIKSIGTSAVPALVEALDDADAAVRMTAASALGVIGDRSTKAVLAPHLLDPDARVREEVQASMALLRLLA